MNTEKVSRRPAALRRGWMFVPGMDVNAQRTAISGGADAVVADLEEFTTPADRPAARARIQAMFDECRARGVVGGVRVNKLDEDGIADLAGIMAGRPDVVFIPHAETPEQVILLDREISALEAMHGIPAGSTEIAPTIESAAGLLALGSILRASQRVKACLLAAEDLAASLGAERGPDGFELLHARGRFLLECVAAGCVAIDCPCTFRAVTALESDLQSARRLGFKSKCVVFAEHVTVLNRAFTPSNAEVAAAHALLAAFEAQRNHPPTDLSHWVDAPYYNNARRLLARHQTFTQFDSTSQ